VNLDKFILASLNGGLGNQIFQYAHARAHAAKNNVPLYFDLSFFNQEFITDTPRVYLLDQYSIFGTAIPEKLADKYRHILSTGWRHRLASRFPKIFSSKNINCIGEQSFSYNPVLIDRWPVQLKGYWQSEKYFLYIRDQLINEISLKQLPNAENLGWLRKITSCDSICLHVRRGDYVTNPAASKTHGLCGIDYYQKAIINLGEKIPAGEFFVFSDDLQWSKDHLKFTHPSHFVDCNPPDKGPEDLRLMQNCKHFITANSSFSWWAAWLGQNPFKIVISPTKWFATGNYDTSDLYPSTWIRL